MAKIIDLTKWKQRKDIEKKEIEQVQAMINKIRTPNFIAMWIGVVVLSFFPWGIFLTIGLLTTGTEQSKLLGAIIATTISPFITLTATKMVFNEVKSRVRQK